MKVEQRLRRLNKRSHVLFILAVACSVAAALLLIGQAVLISAVVARVFLGEETLAAVLPILALILIFILGRSVFIWLSAVIAQRSASHLKSDLRLDLTRHLLRLGPAYTVGERSGELVNTAVSAVETLDAYITQFLTARTLATIVPLLVLLTILILDPWTTLVLIFAGPMLILILALIGGRTKAIAERRFVEMSWMSAFFLDMLQGLETLKLFGRSREQVDNIREISSQYGSTTMDILRTAFQTSLVMEWAATAATAMVALEVSLRLMNGQMSFFQALAVLLLTPEFFLPLRQMSLSYHAGTAGKTAAERVFSVLDTQPAAAPSPQPLQSPTNDGQQTAVPTGDLRFEDVTVTYIEGQRPALNGVSLVVGQGRKVALLGQTGAGKSTIIRLLLRFIEPDSGRITVGGQPLDSIAPDAWRTQVAWVPQNPHLFHGTVAANLRLARPGASPAELAAAAQAAHAHEFIAALPQGYNTPIVEQGLRLSGGQRQRLAIARAYLKDAPIIILDEPTANLDLASEALVRESLDRLVQGRTLILITHRLQMVQDMDEVLEIANGRITGPVQNPTFSPSGGSKNGSARRFAGGQA